MIGTALRAPAAKNPVYVQCTDYVHLCTSMYGVHMYTSPCIAGVARRLAFSQRTSPYHSTAFNLGSSLGYQSPPEQPSQVHDPHLFSPPTSPPSPRISITTLSYILFFFLHRQALFSTHAKQNTETTRPLPISHTVHRNITHIN